MSMETQIIVDCSECDKIRKLKEELLDLKLQLHDALCNWNSFDTDKRTIELLAKEIEGLKKELGL